VRKSVSVCSSVGCWCIIDRVRFLCPHPRKAEGRAQRQNLVKTGADNAGIFLLYGTSLPHVYGENRGGLVPGIGIMGTIEEVDGCAPTLLADEALSV
jgi:hypothetical protein